MKKVLSIAISSLLVGNLAYADTSNENLLVTIQKKIEAKKSGLGSDVQTSSGLASINKPKQIDKEVTSLNTTKVVENNQADAKIKDNKPLTSSTEVINSSVAKTSTDKPVVLSSNIISTPENCEPTKPKVVKKVVKKITKPKVAKTPVKNDFEI